MFKHAPPFLCIFTSQKKGIQIMTKNFNILFYIRKDKADEDGKAPIYCRITVDGKRSELAIKRYTATEKWNSSKGYVKGNSEDARGTNVYIDSVRSKIYEHQKLLMEANKPATAAAIKNSFLGLAQKSMSLFRLFEEHNRKVKELVQAGKDFSQGTLDRYDTVLRHLKEFVKLKYSLDDILLADIDHSFIQEFDHFLRTVRNCENNTAVKYIKNFKKIIRDALAKGLITADPFLSYKAKLKKVDRGFLTQEEIDSISGKELSILRLAQVRDIFIFQCYTGLAYADIKKLRPEHIVKGADGQQWINTRRVKTDTMVNVPILPAAQAILDRYADHPQCINMGFLLPVLSNQKMNSYLKEIADLTGITKNLSSHLARHCFSTTITLSNGVSLEAVSKMLGHTNLNTTKQYARMVDSRVSDEMNVLKTKLKMVHRADAKAS
jgi:site-specific recombinase XerD